MSSQPLQAARDAIAGLVKTRERLDAGTKVLDRLESLVHISRARRAPDVSVTNVAIQTGTQSGVGVVVQVTANTGDFGQYNTRITFTPKAGYKCSCPDLAKRHVACKHVAALAVVCRKRFWALSDVLTASIDKMGKDRDELEALYVAMPLLTQNLESKAVDALKDALKSLGT